MFLGKIPVSPLIPVSYTHLDVYKRQAVAHHRDDLAETVLLNLIRGTGIRGLSGISPKNNSIVRPLLGISRDEIEAYVDERKLPFIFDSSNSDDAFVRNFLRLNVIPLLEKINPSVKNAIYRTAQHAVSYTHLDVYKRQNHALPVQLRSIA